MAESFEDFAARLAARRAALGERLPPATPRSAGVTRTDSKRALLAAIKDAGGDW